jgi:hypothetical protein
MQKRELLQELSSKIQNGEISSNEVMEVVGSSSLNDTESEKKGLWKHVSVTKALYILGTVIAIAGVIFFVGQVWGSIGSIGHILITLGLGLLIALMGSILMKQKTHESVGSTFHVISGILIPTGAVVTISEFVISPASLWPITFIFLAIFIFYLLLNLIHKNVVLTFFSIVNGTVFTYLLFQSLIYTHFYGTEELYAYLTMLVGIGYILMGYHFHSGWNRKLTSLLYFFGSAEFLGAAFSQIFNSTGWQILYLIFIVVGLFISTRLKSREMLVVSTLFFIGYIIYITNEYFAHSIGWPISLVILGFIFIGLGYFSVSLNRKYIQNN